MALQIGRQDARLSRLHRGLSAKPCVRGVCSISRTRCSLRFPYRPARPSG